MLPKLMSSSDYWRPLLNSLRLLFPAASLVGRCCLFSMDPTQQISFRPKIEARLAAIASELADINDNTDAIAPDVSIGRLSRLDAMQSQQMSLAGRRLLEQEANLLNQALQRIQQGTYGRCQLCGQDIHLDRLNYQLHAVACVPCLEKSK